MPLHYEIVGGQANPILGEGWTISLNSRQIVFEAAESLPVGTLVQLRIDWPTRELTLDVRGTAVEAQGQQTTVEVSRHALRSVAAVGPSDAVEALSD